MTYQTLVGNRNARIVYLLENNSSVQAFIQDLCTKLTAHAAQRGSSFARLHLDEPHIVNVTGDEKIRARILRG